MYTFTDPLGTTITLSETPRRIVSLVPSQTELLFALGLNEEVVGITKFCIHPAHWFREKTRIGGTKDVRPEKIHPLRPDLILANKEENDRSQIEELARHYPVWVSDVKDLPGALEMIRSVGALTAKKEQAETLAAEIAHRFDLLPASSANRVPGLTANISPGPTANILPIPITAGSPPSPLTAYFIWRNPWMVAGGDTFINDMLHRAGLTNFFQHRDRYPSIELISLAGSPVQQVLLSSEPYPFKEQHIKEVRSFLPTARIRLVDGELFSWYGSRLLETPAYFQRLFAD